jgi:hypothetical protein
MAPLFYIREELTVFAFALPWSRNVGVVVQREACRRVRYRIVPRSRRGDQPQPYAKSGLMLCSIQPVLTCPLEPPFVP